MLHHHIHTAPDEHPLLVHCHGDQADLLHHYIHIAPDGHPVLDYLPQVHCHGDQADMLHHHIYLWICVK